ncbi:MAG: DUF1467 family protein [Alphaproteobacteria bacterium]|nr:DUF1467 family protein [Alphaproteobacteria bacterium]
MTRQRFSQALVIAAVLLWIALAFIASPNIGMVSGLVVFLCAWWMVFFTVLPQQIRGQHEDGDIVPGSEPGAPTDPQIRAKLWLTTVIAAGVWMLIVAVLAFELVQLDWFTSGRAMPQR